MVNYSSGKKYKPTITIRDKISKSKYKNIKTEVDDIKFDSRLEARIYNRLKLLIKSGHISEFKMQVVYILQDKYKSVTGKNVRAIKYVTDFVVYKDNKEYVIDVKGAFVTDVAKIKKKMFEYKFKQVLHYVDSEKELMKVLEE